MKTSSRQSMLSSLLLVATSGALVAACGSKRATPPAKTPVVSTGSDGSGQGSQQEVQPASKKETPSESASHSANITHMAVAGSGRGALTLDDQGGVRLWPSLSGDIEPQIVYLNQAKEIALLDTKTHFVAGAIDASGGIEIVTLSTQGARVNATTIRNDAGYLKLAALHDVGFLAVTNDQMIQVIDASGKIVRSAPSPVGVRIVELLVGETSAYGIGSNNTGNSLFKISANGDAPVKVAAIPAEIDLPSVRVSPNGKLFAGAILGSSACHAQIALKVQDVSPQDRPKQEQALRAKCPPTDSIVVFDAASGKQTSKEELKDNPFSMGLFRFAFVGDNSLLVGQTRVRLISLEKIAAVTPPQGPKPQGKDDPWAVASAPAVPEAGVFDPGGNVGGTISDQFSFANGQTVLATGSSLILQSAKLREYIGYKYPSLMFQALGGNEVIARTFSGTQSVHLDVRTGQVKSELPLQQNNGAGVLVDAETRIEAVNNSDYTQITLELVSLSNPAAARVKLPSIAKYVSAVQYSKSANLVAVRNAEGAMIVASYDRKNNKIGSKFAIQNYPQLYFTDPAKVGGVVMFAARTPDYDGPTPSQRITPFKLANDDKKTGLPRLVPGTPFTVPASVIGVDSNGDLIGIAPAGTVVESADQEMPSDIDEVPPPAAQVKVTYNVYRAGKVLRSFVLPGSGQLSPSADLMMVRESFRITVFDLFGKPLWRQAAPAGPTYWADDGKTLFMMNDPGFISYEAMTGKETKVCGWKFGKHILAPDGRSFAGGQRSYCE